MEQLKNVGDGVAAGFMVATLLKWLPAIAALFTIVWTGMRMYDWIKGKLDGNFRNHDLDS